MNKNIFSSSVLGPYNQGYVGTDPKAWQEMDRRDYDFLIDTGVNSVVALNIFLVFYGKPFVSRVAKMLNREGDYNRKSDVCDFINIAYIMLESYYDYYNTTPYYKVEELLLDLSEKLAEDSDEDVEILMTALHFSVSMADNVVKNFDSNTKNISSYGNIFDIFSMIVKVPEFSSELMNRMSKQLLYDLQEYGQYSYAFSYTGIVKDDDNEEDETTDELLSITEDYVYIGVMRGLFPYNHDITDSTVSYGDMLPLITDNVDDIVPEYIEAVRLSGMNDLFRKDGYSDNYYFDCGSITSISKYLSFMPDDLREEFINVFDTGDTKNIPSIINSIILNCDTDRDGVESYHTPNQRNKCISGIIITLTNCPMILRYLTKKVDDPTKIGTIAYLIADKIAGRVSVLNRLGPFAVNISSQINIVNMLLDGTDVDTVKSMYGNTTKK